MSELESRAAAALTAFDANDLDIEYMLGPCIAEGGMAAVHKCKNGPTHVAIKVPLRVNPKTVLRLARERQALGLFDSPNICRLVNFGMIGRKPALVLEWIDGFSLSKVIAALLASGLDRRQKLLVVRLLFHKLATCVELVHARGMVHRDLTPANFLITRELVTKLIDFGVVAPLPDGLQEKDGQVHGGNFNLTQDEVPGTPLYMAPELLQMAKPEVPADVYSLAAVLFFMVTGAPPFADAPHETALLYRKTSPDGIPDARRTSDFCPAWLSDLIRRAAATNPDDRILSVAEVRAEFPLEHERTASTLLDGILTTL